MIARIRNALLLALVAAMPMVYAEQTKGARRENPVPVMQHSGNSQVWLTQEQAQQILVSIDALIRQMQEMNKQNKAPRPGLQPGDPAYPLCCGGCDLTPILCELCKIEAELLCCCGTITDILGACTDLSVVLPTQTDKEDIDSLCLSVVSLLKTILLELRGVFLVV